MVRQCFVCEVCDTELEDNTNSAKVQSSKDRMRRFNAQMKWIRDAIRATEGIVLPAYVHLSCYLSTRSLVIHA